MSTGSDTIEVAVADALQYNPREHYRHHSATRLRRLLRSDGREVHVATAAEDLDKVRSNLQGQGYDVEVVLHGTPEHVQALQDSHTHHSDIQNTLREMHGSVYHEIERVIRHRDALAEEMLQLDRSTSIQLSESFSRYGYSAHIRTYGHGTQSSSATSLRENSENMRDWEAERFKVASIKFFVKPIVRQYHHNGLLWRASETQEVASYELFVDLLYVAIVGFTGDSAADDATGDALLRFVITFTMAWKLWSELTVTMAWFESNDLMRRIGVLLLLACLLGFTVNMAGFNEQTYLPLVTFYLAARLFATLYNIWYAYLIPMVRTVLVIHIVLALVSAGIWIGSIHVDGNSRQALIWIALCIELFGPALFLMWAVTHLTRIFPLLEQLRKKYLEFMPAINIEHRIERTGGFVTLVFGYSVISLLYQNASAVGATAFLAKAICGLLQAFSFNIIYFEADRFNLHNHAIRRHYLSALIWTSAHLPFTMAFVISGAALSRLVLAHDCQNADPGTLTNNFAMKSQREIDSGQRWFYCGGLGISLLCTCIIAATHTYKSLRRNRYSKEIRLVFRCLVSLVICFLGFAESLDSLTLISTTTGLVFCVLVVEILFDLFAEEDEDCTVKGYRAITSRLFQRRRNCEYSARCHIDRKHSETSIKNGTNRVDDLRAEKGGFDLG